MEVSVAQARSYLLIQTSPRSTFLKSRWGTNPNRSSWDGIVDGNCRYLRKSRSLIGIAKRCLLEVQLPYFMLVLIFEVVL